MIYLLNFELNFLKSKRTGISLLSLFIILSLIVLLIFYSNYHDHKRGLDLAKAMNARILSINILALFYMVWILQHYLHLFRCKYYGMLKTFGLSRYKLFIYLIIQSAVYSSLFQVVLLTSSAITGLFYNTWPWQTIMAIDIHMLISQWLVLFALGIVMALISTFNSNPFLLAPVLFYWFIESWIASILAKQYDGLQHFLPFKSILNIIGSQVLMLSQLITVCVFISLLLNVLYLRIMTKNLS